MVGVSQHPQGLDFAGAIIFSQSLMAAASSICEDAIASAEPNIAAPAKRAGVNATDKEIKTARMKCRRSTLSPFESLP